MLTPSRPRVLRFVVAFLALPLSLLAQGAAKPAYPVPPRPLPEAQEIELALSAAPSEISSKSDVYVLRGTDYVKVRTGTNGGACMVGRDLHEGSRYPICFDREGAKPCYGARSRKDLRERKECRKMRSFAS